MQKRKAKKGPPKRATVGAWMDAEGKRVRKQAALESGPAPPLRLAKVDLGFFRKPLFPRPAIPKPKAQPLPWHDLGGWEKQPVHQAWLRLNARIALGRPAYEALIARYASAFNAFQQARTDDGLRSRMCPRCYRHFVVDRRGLGDECDSATCGAGKRNEGREKVNGGRSREENALSRHRKSVKRSVATAEKALDTHMRRHRGCPGSGCPAYEVIKLRIVEFKGAFVPEDEAPEQATEADQDAALDAKRALKSHMSGCRACRPTKPCPEALEIWERIAESS